MKSACRCYEHPQSPPIRRSFVLLLAYEKRQKVGETICIGPPNLKTITRHEIRVASSLNTHMKLLLLSLCGRDNEDEDVSYLNLYLASLRRHVIPHFDTRVILFSTFNATTKTQARVNAFGLGEQVRVYGYNDIGLPAETAEFLRNKVSYFPKIGLNMNLLFDYAQQHNFFEADWIFHTDTDIEFLENFAPHITALQGMTAVNPKILVSCAGDTYLHNFRYREQEYIFNYPPRWNAYTEPPPTPFEQLFLFAITRRPEPRQHPFDQEHRLVFNAKSVKVRNDFVGLSRALANTQVLNWAHTYSPLATRGVPDSSPDMAALQELWNEHHRGSNLPLELQLNEDKGSSILYWLKHGTHDVTWVQLRGYRDMANHYSAGWGGNNNFSHRAIATLRREYSDTEHIWAADYPT